MRDGQARENAPEPPLSRAVWAGASLWIVLLEIWFQGPVLGRWLPRALAALPALLLLLLAARGVARQAPVIRGQKALLAVLAGTVVLAIAARLPALVAPAGLLSSDSAVAGIIAQEMKAGHPAPIYAPGFPYEGTLKPHLTVALDAIVPGGLVVAYTAASLLLYCVWIGAVVLLAWRVAGIWAASAAGAFMAVAPRFLTAFSLNNVGQYPDVNALGTLGLAVLALGGGVFGAAFLVGLAVWQQLLGVYFVLVLGLAVLVTPALRRLRVLGQGGLGFLAGSYPLWIWNAANGFATFDIFRRGGKNPADRHLGLHERIERTVAVSLPKLFGLSDLGIEGAAAALLGLLLPVAIVAMTIAKRGEIARLRGRSPVLLCALLLVVVMGVFAASKFSNRGASRPRYLMPIYTSAAVAFGWGLAALGRRSRALAVGAGCLVLGANAAGTIPWLLGRRSADARDRALVSTLNDLGVKTGYAGFWVAPKYTFLSEGRLVLSGELGPDASWVYPPHAVLVRNQGPDAFVVVQGPLVDGMAARLQMLGVDHRITRVSGMAIFSGFTRPVSLEDVEGYDGATRSPEPQNDVSADEMGG